MRPAVLTLGVMIAGSADVNRMSRDSNVRNVRMEQLIYNRTTNLAATNFLVMHAPLSYQPSSDNGKRV